MSLLAITFHGTESCIEKFLRFRNIGIILQIAGLIAGGYWVIESFCLDFRRSAKVGSHDRSSVTGCVGAALLLMQVSGLSMAMGAFLGVLLSGINIQASNRGRMLSCFRAVTGPVFPRCWDVARFVRWLPKTGSLFCGVGDDVRQGTDVYIVARTQKSYNWKHWTALLMAQGGEFALCCLRTKSSGD